MLMLLLSTGCFSNRAAGRIEAVSKAEDPVRVDLEFPDGCYTVEPSELSMYASDLDLEELMDGSVTQGKILHAQLLWSPLPGSTPVDPTATNLTLRLVLISDGELGLYGGAGFAWPRGTIGEDPVELDIVGSTLTLLHATEGFRDLLSPMMIVGRLKADHDPVKTLRVRQAASQLVTDMLGETQWVGPEVNPSWVARAVLPADP